MTDDLTQVIADARGEAAVLRRAGNGGQADYIEAICDRVHAAAEDYVTWLSEADAVLKSGLAPRTLHRRFRELVDCNLGRWKDGERQYRACAVPPRPNVAAARERGKTAA